MPDAPYNDPFDAFDDLWGRVQRTAPEGFDPATVALATADATGRPSARMVLLRGVDRQGFLFYTNYGSRKAGDLDTNPRAAVCGFWHWLRQQVRIEGVVTKATAGESDAYFASRPRESRLGAWASPQSRPIESRRDLEWRLRDAEARFPSGPVPRPDFWGGYRLVPDRMEFWEEGPFRLHDRLLYVREDSVWTVVRLAP
jgi:pyridoxamine 5'-phosphate oxidase